jgi:2-polyprenyl-3-methyl-5-hydroxy-6-metoxy-1,4-benzoquinol methylase
MHRKSDACDVAQNSGLAVYHKAARDNVAEWSGDYESLGVFSLPGLHEFVVGVLKTELSEGSVLDLAAGTGGLSARCMDAGFKVTAADAVPENFKVPGIQTQRVNLDEEHWDIEGAPYHAVLGLEVIEHLENARNFLRGCARLLDHGGLAIITTPNILSPVSKAMFCRTGRYQWFSEDQTTHGHISPVSAWQLQECAVQAGFRVRRTTSYGDAFRAVRTTSWWKMYLLAKFIKLVDSLPSGQGGEILVMILEKK